MIVLNLYLTTTLYNLRVKIVYKKKYISLCLVKIPSIIYKTSLEFQSNIHLKSYLLDVITIVSDFVRIRNLFKQFFNKKLLFLYYFNGRYILLCLKIIKINNLFSEINSVRKLIISSY